MRFTARNLELVRIALRRAIDYYPLAEAEVEADTEATFKLIEEREEMAKLLFAVESKFVDAPTSNRVEIEATATAE